MVYISPESNFQIKEILKKHKNQYIYYRICLLISSFVKKDDYYNFIFVLLKNRYKQDMDFFKEIRKHISPMYRNPISVAEKQYNRLINLSSNLNIKKYLDFGCGGCDSTYEFGKKLGLGKNDIYGTDIKDTFESSWDDKRKNTDINFKYSSTSNIIPFECKFDLITCIMVLHHITDELENTLKCIYNSLNDGGLLLIKEHNCINDTDKIFADLTHSLFIIQSNPNISDIELEKKIFQQTNNYKSAEEWSKLMIKTGFKELSSNYCKEFESMTIYHKGYFALYLKS